MNRAKPKDHIISSTSFTHVNLKVFLSNYMKFKRSSKCDVNVCKSGKVHFIVKMIANRKCLNMRFFFGEKQTQSSNELKRIESIEADNNHGSQYYMCCAHTPHKTLYQLRKKKSPTQMSETQKRESNSLYWRQIIFTNKSLVWVKCILFSLVHWIIIFRVDRKDQKQITSAYFWVHVIRKFVNKNRFYWILWM